jgi:Mce-associated membrane protein
VTPEKKKEAPMLKLVKGGATEIRPVRRRTAVRRTPVTPPPDPIEEVLAHLDELPTEPVEEQERPVSRTVRRRSTTRKTAPRKMPPAIRKPARPSGSWVTVAVIVVALAAVVAAVVLGMRWNDDRTLNQAHERALAAAKQTTVNFVSVSAATVDRDLQRILDGATGDFRDEFTRGQSQVRSAVVENKVDSHGTVLRSALVSGDRHSAVVLVAIDATVKNVKTPDGRASHYRIQVDVSRDPDSGKWLVSKLQFVG